MAKEINIGDVGVFSGRNDKKVKIIRINEKTVTFLIIDENKTKYIYTEDFKKKFTPENVVKTVLKQNPESKEFFKEVELEKEDKIQLQKIQNLLKKEKVEKLSKPTYTIVGIYLSKDRTNYEETENLNQKGLLGYRIRYNKEPNMFFGNVNYSLEDLDEAKKRLQNSNENAEKQKEFQKIRDAENKIKREQNQIIEKQKLEAANKEIVSKPSFLMTLSEYQEKVVPILQEYQKFLRKNSKYLQSADYDGIYQYTYPELEDDFKNKIIKGWKFSRTFYDSNPLKEFKGSHYPSDEIVEMNKSFVNKLKNFFTDDEIYSRMSKDEYKSNKRAVKRAIDNDTYKNLLESEELTESELQKIADSVDVSIPKKVFSVENVKIKEMQEKFAKLLSDLPTINKEQLNKLIQSIKIDFKPLEEELFVEEKAKYNIKFDNLVKKEKVYVSNLEMTIKIWQDLFSYEKLGYDKIKTGRYKTNYYNKKEEEIIDEEQYAVGLKLKSNWETLFDKFLKNYIDTLKYSFINAIINNFIRITKPIIEIVKLRIELGEKGFEGVYRFKFDDGSYFDFKAEAIRAGGYNIQILHLRYITNFQNITLADGSKVKGYYNLIENFNTKTMEKGGRLGQNIKCVNCGWHWNTNQSEKYDKYVCHKCGFDNTTFYSSEIMKHGGLTSHDIQSKTDKYKDILKTPSNLLKISQMHKVPVEFLQSQLIKGMKVESEHTNKEIVAKIIALHHLQEDPRYYIKLEKVEGHIMADGGLVYKKIYNRAGGGYTTIINGMLYNINKQYNKGTWVAQSDDGEYYKETQTLAELKDYLKYLNKKNTMADGGVTAKDSQEMINTLTQIESDFKSFEAPQTYYKQISLKEINVDKDNSIVNAEFFDESGGKLDGWDRNYLLLKLQDWAMDFYWYPNVELGLNDVYITRSKSSYQSLSQAEKEAIWQRMKPSRIYKFSIKVTSIPKIKSKIEKLEPKEEQTWTITYSTENDNTDKVWVYGRNKDEAIENAKDEYWDIKKIISVQKNMAKGGELNPDDKAVKSAMTHKAGSAGGLLVGNRHSEGGIKAMNKSTNSPIEMEGGEVVITRNAVSDNSKREFEGKMMTNREILSRINESGGGVSFASGGDVPSSCKCSGKSYKYGGKSLSDYDIINNMNSNIEN